MKPEPRKYLIYLPRVSRFLVLTKNNEGSGNKNGEDIFLFELRMRSDK
jgi:hypothetical protein